jgi:hypothetical protein
VDEVLAGVLSRGRHLRRRHRIAVRIVGAFAVVICMVGVAAAAASTGGPGHHRVVAATGEAATSTVPEETTTSSSSSTVPAPATTSTTVSVRHRGTTTTSTLYCHNSTDPRCGPFRWTVDPGPNEPATVGVTWTPEQPTAGQDVTFTVTLEDPDAPSIRGNMNLCIGDGGPCVSGTRMEHCDRYGPWDPPPREALHDTWTVHHSFAKEGVYSVGTRFTSTSNFCEQPEFDPYGSTGEFAAQITVSPSTTTTTR